MRPVSLLAGIALSLAGLSGTMAFGAGEPLPVTSTTHSGTYLQARSAAMHHHLRLAAQLYQRALRDDPDNGALTSTTYFYTAAAGEMHKSFDLARRVIKFDPDQHVAHLSLAVEAMRDRDYARAVSEIRAAAGNGHMSYASQLFEVWAFVGEGKRAEAEKALNALAAAPDVGPTVDFNRAMIADYLGDTKAAAAGYAKIAGKISVSPRMTEAYGRFLERNGRADEARALYEKVKGNMAFQPVASAGLKRIADGEKPEPMIENPAAGAAEALLGVASALNAEPQADISLMFLHFTKYLRPEFPLADIVMAGRYELVGHFDRAVQIYQSFDTDSPYYRIAAIQNASDNLGLGRKDKALEIMHQLIDRYPADSDVWITYGDILRESDRNKDAVYAYSRAIAALPSAPGHSDWMLYYSRANAAMEAGNWPAAEADLKVALKLNPNEPHVLNFLGYSWVEKHENLHKAMAMLEKASRLDPDNGFITDSVGWAYYRLGQYDKATARLEQAVEQAPGDPTINDHLGDAYWKVGRQREARFQWNHALAFGAAGEEKAKVEEKLKNGLNG